MEPGLRFVYSDREGWPSQIETGCPSPQSTDAPGGTPAVQSCTGDDSEGPGFNPVRSLVGSFFGPLFAARRMALQRLAEFGHFGAELFVTMTDLRELLLKLGAAVG
jgi:hypothetical protein